MKKIFTYSFLFAVCFSFFASCSKDVKVPKPAGSSTSRTTSTYTGTQTTDQNHGGNGCGSSYGDHNTGNGY